MEGEVWIDKKADKKNPGFKEGTREAGDTGYKNAEVYIYKVLRDRSGNVVSILLYLHFFPLHFHHILQ